jgi:hypothetical protein
MISPHPRRQQRPGSGAVVIAGYGFGRPALRVYRFIRLRDEWPYRHDPDCDASPKNREGRACRPVPLHFASGGDGCRQSALGFCGLALCLATETNHSAKHQ